MKILALSKVVFDRLMREKNVTPANVEQQDRILFISINEQEDDLPADYRPYFPENKKNVKVMYFSDVEKDQEVTMLDGSGNKHWVYAMSEAQAAELYAFIKDNIKGKDAVIVHCTLGVARSGAIAAFINDYVSGSWEMFKNDNKQILPNAHVYRLLHDQWYEDQKFPIGWTEADEESFKYKVMNPLTRKQELARMDDLHGTHTTEELMTESEVIKRWGTKLLNQRKTITE
jgi:hypothetical protein